MTLFIQRADRRDTLAIHAKLDELLKVDRQVAPSSQHKSMRFPGSYRAIAALRTCCMVTSIVAAYILSSSVKNVVSGWDDLHPEGQLDEDSEQQELEPADEASEAVSDGGQDGVGGVAVAVPEIVAGHSMLGLEMADDRLDGGAPAQLAFDLRRHPPLLA